MRVCVRTLCIVTTVFALDIAPHAAAAQAPIPVSLKPGDGIRIEIKDEPALSGQFQIGEDGRVLLPLVGFVSVAGRPFDQVQDEIAQAYGRELVSADLRVIPLQRIAVLGEVRAPGLYPLDPTHTVADALAAAGGLGPQAGRGKISLVRNGAVIRGRLDPGSTALQLAVRSGDQIIVGRRGWVGENAPILLGALASVAAAAVTSLIIR